MKVEDFKEFAKKYGMALSAPGARYAKMKFIGDNFDDIYSFNYCGVNFYFNSSNNYVVIDKIPFEVLNSIYSEKPEVFAGERPYMSYSDDLYEADLKKITGLDRNSAEYNKLYLEALDRLAKRPTEKGFAKNFKIKTKEGLTAVINCLSLRIKSLDGWLNVYGGKLTNINAFLRDNISEFDRVVGSITTPSTNKVTDSESKNYIFSHSNENDFVCEVKYKVEDGKIAILTHYYSKNGIVIGMENGKEIISKGESVMLQLFEGNVLVAHINCNFTDRVCTRFNPKDKSFDDETLQPEDEVMILEVIRESISYAHDIATINKRGKGKK